MSTLQIELPDAAFHELSQLASKADVPLKDFAARALQEAIAAQHDRELLEERARRANRARFEAVMAKVPDVEPEPNDKL